MFGNINFEAIGEHLEAGNESSEKMYWPFAVMCYNNKLAVADTGNHRIVLYNIPEESVA